MTLWLAFKIGFKISERLLFLSHRGISKTP